MSEEENVEVVRRILGRLGKTGKPDLSDLHPNIEIHDHELPDSEVHHGHGGYIRSIQDWESAWSDYGFDLEELIDAGDRVVVILHTTATGRTSGIKLDRRDAQVYELRDGKVVRLEYFSTRAEALEAAGVRDE